MYKTNPLLIEKCRRLRTKGFTLNEIIEAARLPKTTVYDNICDIPLSFERKKEIQENAIKRIVEFSRKRKGKCIPGRIVPKPQGWTNDLIFLVAHFIFDGEVQTHSCIYHNRNEALLYQVEILMKNVFNLKPYKWLNEITGVRRISYHYVELAEYIRKRIPELKDYIKFAPIKEKRMFLKAFFDDEGSARFDEKRNKREVRGYQHNLEILKLVQRLLNDFNIKSKIDEKYKEIVVSRKSNLIQFRNKINFSKGIYINPNRKNSIWKKKLEKRKILDYIISSYTK